MANKQSINQAKYDRENVVKISLKLHKRNDKDILEKVDPNNKQGSIKKLIRRGLEK